MAADKQALENEVLRQLGDKGSIPDTMQYLALTSREGQHDELVGVLKSLEATGHTVAQERSNESSQLTVEGDSCLKEGSREFKVFNAVGTAGCTKDELHAKLGKGEATLGMNQAMRLKWLQFDKAAGKLSQKEASVVDVLQKLVQRFASGAVLDKKESTELQKRKMVETRKFTTWKVEKGPAFGTSREKKATDLTYDMLRSGKWEDTEFKDYKFDVLGQETNTGALHPLMKVRKEFRNILLEMGFEEMPTNRFVESSFWNFDALFQPQQHPARDSHDTFFCSKPAKTLTVPRDYLERVKKMHEVGGQGSIGYRYDWSEDETRKNILRTHTTAISSRMLYKLAQNKPFKPMRYFSIDRVFRNESLDATHLAEFHQVEGVVADVGLTLGDLIGTIRTFMNRIGITDLRFKPAFNPYTEPSMEIFGFSKELNKWIEVGNSGMFRPEMLNPMGLPENVRVIAWGLSLERPTMIKYGINNIRDLFGPKVKLNIINQNPIARYGLDKEEQTV